MMHHPSGSADLIDMLTGMLKETELRVRQLEDANRRQHETMAALVDAIEDYRRHTKTFADLSCPDTAQHLAQAINRCVLSTGQSWPITGDDND